MKKNINKWWLAIAIIFIAYNVIVWVLPVPKTTVFYLSYLFTLIAIISQIYVVKIAFYNEDVSVKSKFYGFPIEKIGYVYLSIQLVVGLVFMHLGKVLPEWIVIIVYVVLFAFFVIGTISTNAVREVIEEQDVKLVEDTSKMRYLQLLAERLPSQASDETTKKELRDLFEALKYSDPVSSEATTQIEQKLEDIIITIENSIAEQDPLTILGLCKKATVILEERNIICKRNK